jgi:nucleotide-binding universal stress UspA family protein
MNTHKILFPTDLSARSEFCLEQATDLARARGATLLICHVEEPPMAYGGGELYYGLPLSETRNLAEALEQVVPTHPAVPFEHRLLSGDPASEIVRLAQDEGVELIVLGTHGRTGLKRVLMGSVAEAVVRRATCPVLTIKQPQTAAAHPE